MTPRFIIEPLAPSKHRREEFDCGVPTLNDYLKTRARKEMDAGVAVCFVAVPENEPGLKLERDWKPVDETGFTSFLDPVDGRPLTIDFKLRTIRSRGLNQKADPPDPEGGPLPAAGFFFSGDDFMIVVPHWRSEGRGRGTKAGED